MTAWGKTCMNGRIGRVNLQTGACDLLPLRAEDVAATLGGAAMNAALMTRFPEDAPIILGTGPLTGSFAPASCLGVATLRRNDRLRHIPLTLRSGPELKFAGFDALILCGRSPEPVRIMIRGPRIEICPDPAGGKQTVLQTVRALQGPRLGHRACLLTGPAAMAKVPAAAAAIGAGGSWDKAGLALALAEKNLTGVLWHGTGGLPFHDDHPGRAAALLTTLGRDTRFHAPGFIAVLQAGNGSPKPIRKWRSFLQARAACYHCPFPCMTFARLPGSARAKGTETVLLSDHRGGTALAGRGRDGLALLQAAIDWGLDPEALARLLPARTPLIVLLRLIAEMGRGEKSLSGIPPARRERGKTLRTEGTLTAESERHDAAAPGASGPADAGGESTAESTERLWGGGILPLQQGRLREERIRLAMTLGICPLFLLLFPQITATDLLSFLTDDVAEQADLEQTLRSIRWES